ncbi:STAS-like domain-containing protein [Phytoactinopolyspora halotolerans]|uniref:DUF4325 domain-containing protein n=1 Tax=Phytoactinopolyspora halotolerans TaxID=1981512 RepID=A0A6L9S8A5_9ACTN|nr:DUF4325 domain-containing protein [Phytoactinopolyspora halotolerans]NEE01253.1 DUF4325 domain-containing protein [Phytoactinopolyspora halotolerans]
MMEDVGKSDVVRLVRVSDVARELGLSPSRIRQLADSGEIPSSRTTGGHRLFDLAEVRAAVARRALGSRTAAAVTPGRPADWRQELALEGLEEHEVWRDICKNLELDSASPAGKIAAYAFMEMLNNAIDHSSGRVVEIRWWVSEDLWCFEMRDDGIGAFQRLRSGLHLASDFEAIQELSKGKRTTDPARHTGEGIFFTSKVVDLFRITSSGIRWTVDNLRDDMALGAAPVAAGTAVVCQLDPHTERVIGDVFRQFTDDSEFVRTRTTVRLFELGTMFVSRSEARRLLDGLESDFEIVEVDFTGIDDVGQGFVDELVRVWPNMHPGKSVVPINMNRAVEFMVTRGLRRAERQSGE